jgi:hypothetical protein
MTLNKIENGNGGVYVGNYAIVLFSLGLIDRLADLADLSHDALGRELAEEQLPKRIRLPASPKPSSPKQRKPGGK